MGSYLHGSYDVLAEIKEFSVKEECLNPKVSIIVPVYNTQEFLSKCLLSLVKQTLKEIEIIIVNDASTDSSALTIDLFKEQDARIKVINHQENLKQGSARNSGLKIARAEYISFIDSDDWVDLNFCERLYKSAIQFNADIVTTNIIKHKKTGQVYNVKYSSFKLVNDINLKIKLCCDKKKRFFYVVNKLYKKTFLMDNELFFNEKCYYEDVVFSIKSIFYANNIISVPDTNYHYFYNNLSTINSSMTNQKKIDFIQAYKELQNFAYENCIKLPETLNYITKYWFTPFFKVYRGEYKMKISLFGIIPLFSIQEFKEKL